MKKLSSDQIASITTLLHDGKSTREIAKSLGISKTTVARYRKTITNQVPHTKLGRPRKLSSRDKRGIARMMMNGGANTAVELTKKLNQEREDNVSSETVRSALREQGLRAIKKKKKPRLTLAHRKARLNWALAHKDWTLDDWKRVIWSDETKINRINSDGIKYTWVVDSKSLCPGIIDETIKFGGGNVVIWCCTLANV